MNAHAHALAQTADAAVGFLANAQGADGWWRDFWTPAGISDAWVTGYVGAALATHGTPPAVELATEAWQLLECDRFKDGGWGYLAPVPPDADSTVWALRLAEALGDRGSERTAAARAFLGRHRVPGGVATYQEPGPIRSFVRLPVDFDFTGWLGPHACVTAAAAGLETFLPLLATELAQAQRADGSWTGYWWFEPAYATALAVEALEAGPPTDAARAAVGRARQWARAQPRGLDVPGGAFRLALLLRVLAGSKCDAPEVGRGLDTLLAAQKPDGGWRGGARLRIPRPDSADPDSVSDWSRWFGAAPSLDSTEAVLRHTFGIYSLDQNSIFTTATVLTAIDRCRFDPGVSAPAARPARAVHPASADPVTPAIADAFARDGHALVPDALPAEEIARWRPALVEAVYRIAEETAAEGRAALDRGAFVRSEGVWRHGATTRRFVLHPRLAAIAARLLGVDRVRLFHDQAFFKPPGGDATPWHQDAYYWPLATDRVLTLWVPLVPVEPAMGALRFLNGSHRLGNLGTVVDSLNESPDAAARFAAARGLTVAAPEAIPLGGLSAHLGWTIHGAGPNQGGTVREAITIVCFADGARLGLPPVPPDADACERRADQVRRHDLARWFPGLAAGDRAVGRENPKLHDSRIHHTP